MSKVELESEFLKKGGTELSPMSTTEDLAMAITHTHTHTEILGTFFQNARLKFCHQGYQKSKRNLVYSGIGPSRVNAPLGDLRFQGPEGWDLYSLRNFCFWVGMKQTN